MTLNYHKSKERLYSTYDTNQEEASGRQRWNLTRKIIRYIGKYDLPPKRKESVATLD